TMNPVDSGGLPDTSVADTGLPDTQTSDAKPDTGNNDAGCPQSWTVVPVTDPSIAVPDGGEPLLLHAFGTGTQNYSCLSSSVDGGTTYAWTLTGPEADLDDCMMGKIGSHFASDAGATRPEWLTMAGGYVIGKRIGAYTPPDGGANAVPWLLLQETERGGTGPLSKTNWIHRLNTTGGLAPSSTCDQNTLNSSQKVPYTADYYFYGQ